MAPICTTDATMVKAGYIECVGGDSINELPFNAVLGDTIDYRILGSQGVGLQQTVIAEGYTVAKTDRFVIEAGHVFEAEAAVEEEPVASEEPGSTEEQYASEAPAEETASAATSEVAEVNGGVLPDTGGASFTLLAGAALLLAAGGFLAYRRLS